VEPWQELLASTRSPWLGCTPDGRFNGSLVEIKCISPFSASKWKQGPPAYVLAQVQTQLYVTGFETACVVMWHWGAWPQIFDVQMDHEMQAEIVRETEGVWKGLKES
jgi:hypothetical protein